MFRRLHQLQFISTGHLRPAALTASTLVLGSVAHAQQTSEVQRAEVARGNIWTQPTDPAATDQRAITIQKM